MSAQTFGTNQYVRHGRLIVGAVAAVGFLAKMVFAARTRGPADVFFFWAFSQHIEKVGPVRIYAHPMPGLPVYNHPPLAGWMLLGLDRLSRLGVEFGTLIRTPACLADFAAALLVFEIVRRRRSVRTAVACGIGVTLSPVLVPTSGYHGNTDSVAVTLALAAAWLLADRRTPLAAGVVAALSISVKFVPVVALPALLVAAWRTGRREFLRFSAGLGAVLLVVWGPVVATVPGALRANVLEYKGGDFRLWGIVKFAEWLGFSHASIAELRGPGHFVVVLLCVAAGAWPAWRRPDRAPLVVAITLSVLLLLSTASGVQYLAWPVAALFAIGFWEGLAYSVLAGVLASWVYTIQKPTRWNYDQQVLGAWAWAALLVGVASGYAAVFRSRERPGAPAPHVATTVPAPSAPLEVR
ncbi:glycosyltransferase family 39 protein [Streptomyces crystallinus]|uniref:Glycosyltransferase RgtA/B/C/D-like domain-containing protein n=1 Tax=Streptomyces crystallinus TaxID=68191 RepID=A0ABN1GDQ6_9ACTN